MPPGDKALDFGFGVPVPRPGKHLHVEAVQLFLVDAGRFDVLASNTTESWSTHRSAAPISVADETRLSPPTVAQAKLSRRVKSTRPNALGSSHCRIRSNFSRNSSRLASRSNCSLPSSHRRRPPFNIGRSQGPNLALCL